jgi:hypothetical protein
MSPHHVTPLVRLLKNKYEAILPYLNERSRRIWVANEAISIGRGGRQLLHEATGLSCVTISKGMKELNSSESDQVDSARVRRKGAGRKKNVTIDSGLGSDLSAIVESSTRGDPETPLLWCSKSTRKIAEELNKKTQRASHTLISNILDDMGFSLQGNRKVKEGSSHPDRDAQFRFIADKVKDFQKRNQPVISVDTKKKELIGEFKNAGKEYCKKGTPTPVNVYDFIDVEKGKASPYGIYDLSKNTGWVSVGISSDTAEFAVNSIRSWWLEMGSLIYSEAEEIYINADGGGSNGSRVRLWKTELQQLANEIKKTIHVSHFPPGTSKWNKIEHKMFCFISKNWRGKPLVDTATIVQLISNTTTKKGLTIKARLDEKNYQKGIKITDAMFEKINIKKELFHGEWNYKIIPSF